MKSERPVTKIVDPAVIKAHDAANMKNFAIQVGVVAVIAITVFFLVRHHFSSVSQTHNDAQQTIAQIRSDLNRYRNPQYRNRLSSTQLLQEDYQVRSQQLDTIAANIGEKDPALSAQILLMRADLNWVSQGLLVATTEPSGLQNSPADMLKAAQGAYNTILSKYFPDQLLPRLSAHLGLAAIAENLSNWDEAAAQYNAVLNDPKAPDAMHKVASDHLARLENIKVPIVINIPPPTTLPATTEPASTRPLMPLGPVDLTAPSTMPAPGSLNATMPSEIIEATTLPATQP